MELWNFRGKQNSITGALQLDIPDHAVICLTGAGGKTSLLFAWARELAASGKRVAVTTTTRMYRPAPSDDENIIIAVADDPEKKTKVTALPPGELERLRRECDVVLIEADGSRRKPFKWPAEWEPVVPEYTDITVCVAGLSALGKAVSDVVFRAEMIPEAMKRDVVDENFMRAVLSSPDGGLKEARGEFRVFLNQADSDELRRSAEKLQMHLGVMGIQSAWGSLSTSEPSIAVILQAAGNSRRFGSNKLLHIMDDGRPMVASVIDAVRPLDVSKRIIVTQYEEVAALAPDFDVIYNDEPDLGISRTMQLGMDAAGDTDAYLFCVCDQPHLTTSTLERLIKEFKKGTAGIVSLAWQGKMRNPKIFSSRYIGELMKLSGDTGGRQILSAHSTDIALVEADSEDEVRDIDSL